jgi:hypothetical protein
MGLPFSSVIMVPGIDTVYQAWAFLMAQPVCANADEKTASKKTGKKNIFILNYTNHLNRKNDTSL